VIRGTVKLKYVARFAYGDGLPANREPFADVPVYGSNGPYDYHSMANTRGPAIIVGRKGSYGKVNWTDIPCFASDTTFFIDDRTSRHHLRWLYWLLQTLRLDEGSDEAAVPGLNRETVYENSVSVPPIFLQHAIADFLDRETAKIDALVAVKENVLGVLAEKRRALITRAVTRGLNPDVPLRGSGIPWLAMMPSHWKTVRLKFIAQVRGGLTLGKNYGTATLSEYKYLRVANVQDGRLDLSAITTVLLPENEANSCLLRPGDVLMIEGGDADKLGRGCVWRGEITPCLHQNHVFAVRPTGVLPEWLDVWTSTDAAKNYFESRAKQSTNLASISGTNIKELPVPLPPESEQRTVVAHILQETAKLDALRAAAERTIGLLKERRAALIAAAVTGLIEVKGVNY
jgi:type I restriction enzyme, S subunit